MAAAYRADQVGSLLRPPKLLEASLAATPTPSTTMTVPGGPLGSFREMAGATWKLAPPPAVPRCHRNG